MKYLKKLPHKELASLSYDVPKDRSRIRELLKTLQYGYCAYSERFIKSTDSVHIEHFDGRLKGTEKDSYKNWYAVLAWMNEHKPKKIKPYLPILSPFADDLPERIIFNDGIFKTKNKEDEAAQNLINYLGWNKKALVDDRNRHLKRIKLLKSFCNSNEEFKALLKADKDNLSFVTALEHQFKIPLFDLIIV